MPAVKMRPYPSFSVRLQPSRYLLIGGGIVHGLAAGAVMLASLPPWLKVGFMIGLGLSAVKLGWENSLRCSHRFISRIESVDDRWRLETGDGVIHRASVIGGYAHPAIVILSFRLDGGGYRSLTLLSDSADPESLRRLRVWLRISRDTEMADAAP